MNNNKSINLAIAKKRNTSRISDKNIKYLRLFAISFLTIVGLFSATLFIIIATSPISKLREERSAIESSFSNSNTQYGKYVLTKSRLSKVDSLKKSRNDFATTYDILEREKPVSLNFVSINITEDSMQLGIESASVNDLENYLEYIQTKAEDKTLPSNVIADSITYDSQDNNFRAQLYFN